MTNTELEQGDKVKSYNHEDENTGYINPKDGYRAVVTETKEEEADILYLEGNRKGEIRTEDLEDLEPNKQKIWLAMSGRSYGNSQDKEIALKNVLESREIDEDCEEPVKVWMAEVDRTNWEIRGMGNVYSTFIDNEKDLEIKPDLAREISRRASDTTSLVYSAMDNAEPYREGLNYEVSERTTGW